MSTALTLHKLSRALDRGSVLRLGAYTLRRQVSDEGVYVVEDQDGATTPYADLQAAVVAIATLVGTIEEA